MAELPPVRAMRKPAQACCLSAMAAEVSRMLSPLPADFLAKSAVWRVGQDAVLEAG